MVSNTHTGRAEGTGTPVSSFNCSCALSITSNLLLIIVTHQDTNFNVSTVVRDGQNATFLARNNTGTGTGRRVVETWYIENPNAGTANIVASFTGNTTWPAIAYSSYDGVDMGNFPLQENLSLSGTTTLVGTLTVSQNSWLVMVGRGPEGMNISGDGIYRIGTWSATQPSQPFIADSNGGLTAGSRSITGTLTSGSGTQGIIIELGEYVDPTDFQISGTVTLNGEPVEGAKVRCVRQSDNVAITAETSDSAGEYTFTNLEEEELYHLCVEFEDETEKYYAKSYWDIAPVEVEL